MQQAFMKILENSIQALRGNQGRITVQTRNVELAQPTQDRNVPLAAGAYVCVEITDNGSGIEPDILPRVFEPFFTTKRGAIAGWVWPGSMALSPITAAGWPFPASLASAHP